MITMRLGARALWGIAGSIGLLVVACGGETNTEECLPGDFQAVALADGGSSLLRCTNDGGGYVPYDGPDPNTPMDASVPDAASGGTNGEALGYFCFGCSATSPCAPGLVCEDFPNKGGYLCTLACTSATASVCVAPSAGCGNNGTCKP
jgi:hypothetical protein